VLCPAKYDEEKRVAFAKEELKRDRDGVYYVVMDESWINATHRDKRHGVAGNCVPCVSPSTLAYVCACGEKALPYRTMIDKYTFQNFGLQRPSSTTRPSV
jgi:hypothetical protein